MLAKYVNGEEYVIINSNGKEPGDIEVQGSNPEHCHLVDLSINKMIVMRFAEPNGSTIVRNSKGQVVRNTCSSDYFTNELPKVMEGIGYIISG